MTGRGLAICVDLDGTLVSGDTTLMAVRRYLSGDYRRVIRLLAWLARGRAYLKQRLFAEVKLVVANLPYNGEVIELIKRHRSAGHDIYLVTASDASVARHVVEHFADLFVGYYASDGLVNLRQRAKARLLVEVFGEGQFVYFGNSRDDLVVWQHAAEGVVVSSNDRLVCKAKKLCNITTVIDNTSLKQLSGENVEL